MNNIFVFWTGNNNLTKNRKESLKQLHTTCGANIILVTEETLNEYILKSEPLHPAYEFLSFTHRADYLRTYFMNFYGGGYSDIKKTTGCWKESFEKLKNSDKWIIGFSEPNANCIAGSEELKKEWRHLVSNGCYICKRQSPLTKEWYKDMILLLDGKLQALKKYPASFPQDRAEIANSHYPIEWNEMLGRIFHRICFKYKNKILNTLPRCVLNNYR